MALSSIWDELTPGALYNVRTPSMVQTVDGRAVMPGIERSAGPHTDDNVTAPPWSPDNPLFWFGTLLAATVGLVAASTQLRVGPVRVGGAVGNP